MQIYAEVFQLRSHVVPNGEVTHKTTQLTSCEMWQSVPWALRGVAASSSLALITLMVVQKDRNRLK